MLSGFHIARADGEGNIQSRQLILDHITFFELKLYFCHTANYIRAPLLNGVTSTF